MISGTKNWENRDYYYSQENNPTEHMLKCRLPGGKGWLETCGPTAAVISMASMGRPVEIRTPGGYRAQPEEILTDYLTDPTNFKKLRMLFSDVDPAKIPGNEVAEWYPVAVGEVFGNKCEFAGAMDWVNVSTHLSSGRAVQVCLINPGHFVSLVAVDLTQSEFIYHDPWPGRWPDGDGFCRRMTRREFETNTKGKTLVYW